MSRLPTVILHIGPHKTATTYIQRTLLNNRDELAREGIIYPEIFLGDPGHEGLPEAFKRDATSAATTLREYVANLPGSARYVIFSSENLSLLSGAEMEALHDALSPLPVRPIVYLRDRGPVIWSQYQEHVKFGEVRAFSDYLSEIMFLDPEANAIDPLGLCLRVAGVFGNVGIVSYDQCVAEGRDLTDPIIVAAGGNGSLLSKKLSGPINIRMRQEQVEILRLLNLVHIRKGKKPANIVRSAFLKGLKESHEIRSAEAAIAGAIRSSFVELPLGMLDKLYAEVDSAKNFKLRNAGVVPPAFGAKSSVGGLVVSYLPDSAILFSPIPGRINSIYNMLELDP